MSTLVTVQSACGATSAKVDIFDLPLNPEGVVCCGHCECIIEARESWYAAYAIERLFRTPDNDPFYVR